MVRISSNATMFLKFFIPIIWFIFFGGIMIAIFSKQAFYNVIDATYPGLPWIFLALYVLVVLTLVLTFWRLKRVECDDMYFYSSDYFKTARYPYHQIEEINEHNFFSIPIVDIKLKQKGVFGKKLFFLGRQSTLNLLYNNHDELGKP